MKRSASAAPKTPPCSSRLRCESAESASRYPGRLAAVVEQMAEVVQQRRAYEFGRRTGSLGEMRALQRVLELAHAFPFVGACAFFPEQLQDLLDHYYGASERRMRAWMSSMHGMIWAMVSTT
jgi:hypothetical protein